MNFRFYRGWIRLDMNRQRRIFGHAIAFQDDLPAELVLLSESDPRTWDYILVDRIVVEELVSLLFMLFLL